MLSGPRRIAVTGGAGFIGGHLTELLLAQGHEVVVVDDFSSGSIDNLAAHRDNPQLHIARLDIRDETAVIEAFRGVEYVFHLACRNVRLSLRRPTEVHEVNATGTLNTLKAAAAHKVLRYVYCSSSEVNGTADIVPMPEDYAYQPETIYGASKLTGEYYTQVFQRSGWLDTVIVRPHNNYGPREHYKGVLGEVIPRFILKALAGEPLTIYGDGAQTRDFTYVSETAEFLARLMACPDAAGKTVNLCHGQEVSILEIARLVLELTGSNSRLEHLPGRPSDVLRLFGDNSRLRGMLGAVPSIGIGEGLRRTVDWFRENVQVTPEVLASMSSSNWNDQEAEGWLMMHSARKQATSPSAEPQAQHRDNVFDLNIRELNDWLEPVEDQLVSGTDCTKWPVAFIVGLPRSGTTLLYQVLAASGLFAYPSNLIARFFKNLRIGARIHKIFEKVQPIDGASYMSQYGKTQNWNGPSEFGFFWEHYFDFSEANELSEGFLESLDYTRIKRELAALEAESERPVTMKAMHLNYNLDALSHGLGNVIYLRCRRDPLHIADSLMNARLAFNGTYAKWWSCKPVAWRRLEAELSPVAQVVEQIAGIERAIDRAATTQGVRIINVDYDDLCSNPSGVVVEIATKVLQLPPEAIRLTAPLPTSFAKDEQFYCPASIVEELAARLNDKGIKKDV